MPRPYDIVIFGATGFTGRFVSRYIAHTTSKRNVSAIEQSNPIRNPSSGSEENGFDPSVYKLRWALAGRDPIRLKNLRSEIGSDDVGIIEADVSNDQSLDRMASMSHVLINCVGPYSRLGPPVIKSCLSQRTACLDVSGEPFYLESMAEQFGAEAQARKVQIIGSCGFDSVPADIGVQALLRSDTHNRINRLESIFRIELNGTRLRGNFATWESLVYGFANYIQLKDLRNRTRNQVNFKQNRSSPIRSLCAQNGYIRLPFPGSDRSVVARTLKANGLERIKQFDAWYEAEKLSDAIGLVIGLMSCGALAKYPRSQQMLLDRASLFTFGAFDKRREPNLEDLKRIRFIMDIRGFDESNYQVGSVQINGPDPGYQSAAICVVECARQLLAQQNDRDNLKGGVFTPGSIFDCDQLITRLDKSGMRFRMG